MRKLLTHSAMTMFMSCRMKYVYRQMQMIVPTETTSSLSIGTAVHKGLESWFKHHDAKLAYAMVDSCELNDEDKAKALGMITEYCNQYADDSFTVIAVEKSFKVPLKKRNTTQRSTMFDLAGKVDAVVEIDGQLWLVEHKTTTQMDDDYWARVDIDNQIKTYAVALSIEYKKPVVGCIYDVLRKPMIRMKQGESDEEFEARKAASKTGKIKRKEAETFQEFLERVKADLEANQFVRKRIRFDQVDLCTHAAMLWDVAKDIEKVEKGKAGHYCNTSNCLGYTTCPYLKLCQCHGDRTHCQESYTVLEANSEL